MLGRGSRKVKLIDIKRMEFQEIVYSSPDSTARITSRKHSKLTHRSALLNIFSPLEQNTPLDKHDMNEFSGKHKKAEGLPKNYLYQL